MDKPGSDDLMRTSFHASGEELFAGREEREQHSQLVPWCFSVADHRRDCKASPDEIRSRNCAQRA